MLLEVLEVRCYVILEIPFTRIEVDRFLNAWFESPGQLPIHSNPAFHAHAHSLTILLSHTIPALGVHLTTSVSNNGMTEIFVSKHGRFVTWMSGSLAGSKFV